MPRKKAVGRSQDSEVHAYAWIKRNLELLGWDTRNPERAAAGQVWTQNEVTHNEELKRYLVLDKPENIVKVTDRVLWVIEAKRSHSQLQKAVGEAEDYATALRASTQVQPLFVSGVAGNDIDSYLIRSEFWDGTHYVPITLNGIPATGLLTTAHLEQILRTGQAEISDPRIDEQLFLARAEHINEILHQGAVNPHQRAGVMAALLLAELSSTPPNIEERDPATLISDINGRAQSILSQQGKANFFEYVRINLPSTPDNHVKLRRALVDTIQELHNLNIRSAMNSGLDWLGTFYEVFLKYANWAQDLGIVLTPRHITRFVADVMDVQTTDIVYDPTCGTGGFLVAAFDYVKQRGSAEQVARFKQYSVFGIEQDAGVAALAVVNMIFRGDGKNNIQEGNCFSKILIPHVEKGIPTALYSSGHTASPPVTKVMMNPPFALKAGEEKEFKFVDKALEQMQQGGLLFSVLPYAAMVKPGVYRTWRRDSLLPSNTLVAVVSFPLDLFYPVAVASVGIFVRKGIPHPPERNVLWVRAVNDGLLKRKGRRLPNPRATNDLARSRDVVKAFLANPQYTVPNIERLQKACPIDPLDAMYELVPENYLDQALPTPEELQDGMEQILRNSVAFMIRARKENAPTVQ